MDQPANNDGHDEGREEITTNRDEAQSDKVQPLFRIKSIAPYVDEPVVQQNCIR